ncbi:DNA polymerase IV [Lachnospiraceae bacterium]|nr:DNA polymerase IV [uncultured Schaedlerella sp.]MCI9153360.1 DNA polymerase IV [Ruminococcus sp.]NBI58628.1 DNA polymerase IV [Lachnospiraceae bacterium]
MSPVIFHIDVNSAYLSWTAVEQLKNGAEVDLREIPSIIGGDKKSRHGVVLAKSISAKKYGIRTGEPVVNAFRKCPNLVMEPPNHRMYREKSQKLMEYLRGFTTKIEQVSVDECYLDFTEIADRFPSPLDAAFLMKNGIRERFGFTVNIGISENKLLAKMASDFEKPDKVHTLFLREVPVKMWPLPLGELFMAGRSSVEALKKLEINTIGDLANADLSLIELHLKSHGKMLWEFANGIDHSPVQWEQTEAKGIGNSTTLAEDAATYEEVREVFAGLAESVGRRLRKAGQKANMVSMEIKYHDFQSMSHQTQLSKPTSDEQILLDTACRLFQEAWTGEPVRLLGLRTAKLVDAGEPEQMSIFDLEPQKPVDEKRQRLNAAMNQIKEKYGDDAVMKASRMKKVK